MRNVVLFGAGKIGGAIAELLTATGEYKITIVDRDPASLERMPRSNVELKVLDLSDQAAISKVVHGHEAALSALPFNLTRLVAKSARDVGAHYLDLTEDVESTRTIKELAKGADTAFIPQCGLAPGYISIVANDLAQKFATLREVHMRVGALPVFPTNALK